MKHITGITLSRALSMLLVLLLLAGCGQGRNKGEAEAASALLTNEETSKSLTVGEIYEEITKQVEISSSVTLSDDFISNYYGIKTDELEEYVFSMSEEATSAETIAILKVKQKADLAKMEEALTVVIDQKRGEMEDYLPEEFKIVDKSSVKTNGNYVYLVISKHAKDIEKIIEDAL